MWGVVNLPKGFTLTPGIELRSGFPYSIFSEDYTVVGERNRQDFPLFLSADVALTKRLNLFAGRWISASRSTTSPVTTILAMWSRTWQARVSVSSETASGTRSPSSWG